MALTKTLRFEVFKRDSFTCQYCGQSAPDVVLQVDHIQPRSKHGTDDLLNLVTSCIDCNQGKKAVPLSDTAAIAKRKKQLDELQQRREQLEMLLEWNKSLLSIDDDAVTGVADVWHSLTPGWFANDNGLQTLRKWIKKFGVNEILAAMRAAADQYLEFEVDDNGDQRVTQDSLGKAWGYIPRICTCNRKCQDKPYLKDLYYARGILRNRLAYVCEWQAMQIMEAAVISGTPPSDIIDAARLVSNWTKFKEWIEEVIASYEQQGNMRGER